ncbi:peptidoglycan DD-metalloendopeptidase family protein [Hymenobacter sp. NBH84]|uniref:peptidoglycan DD-metalloendopeptidase family protein n=1 Tax=Hymenobacter sp. NBH84 TaxID=2596915 RepID=UPI001627EEBD|nr:peptidoglycan DD-metalloendopeptidase family protein [Hymenobacter sp. NBH84]
MRTPLAAAPALVLGPPLEAGVWLTHEGPGNPHAHHWGSGVVVANGHTTIPQRYAIDFFGLDSTGHAVRVERNQLAASARTDWNGYGASVFAVANGIVRDVRDGEPDQVPLAPLPPPTALTERGLMGNFVVLEIAPHVYVHYAHLQPGSVRVRVGDRVRRGDVLGRIGQSGNANAPHLHFQVSTAVTFEESEGTPFVFRFFERLGTATLGDVLDRSRPVPLDTVPACPHRRQLPLDGDMIKFP